MAKVSVREASREDIRAFSPIREWPTMRAWLMEVDGTVVGLGGYALSQGRWFGFLDLLDNARPHKMHIARGALRVLDEARKQGIRYLYVTPEAGEENAVRWLTRLGFVSDPRAPQFFRWKA